MSVAELLTVAFISLYSLSDHESLQPNSLDAYLLEMASAAQDGMPNQLIPVRLNVFFLLFFAWYLIADAAGTYVHFCGCHVSPAELDIAPAASSMTSESKKGRLRSFVNPDFFSKPNAPNHPSFDLRKVSVGSCYCSVIH